MLPFLMFSMWLVAFVTWFQWMLVIQSFPREGDTSRIFYAGIVMILESAGVFWAIGFLMGKA